MPWGRHLTFSIEFSMRHIHRSVRRMDFSISAMDQSIFFMECSIPRIHHFIQNRDGSLPFIRQ